MNIVKRLDELGRENGGVYNAEPEQEKSDAERKRELDEYFGIKRGIETVDRAVGLPGRFAKWCGRQADNVVDYAFVAAAFAVDAVYRDKRQLGTNDLDDI